MITQASRKRQEKKAKGPPEFTEDLLLPESIPSSKDITRTI